MRPYTIGTVLIALLVTGCLGSDADSNDPGPPRPAGPEGQIFWEAPDHDANLGGGWIVRSCEGNGGVLCVERDGAPTGTLETKTYPSSSVDNLDPDADPVANLDALADGYHEAIGVDRAARCPSDYVFENLGPDAFVLGGARGVFYGHVGMLPDGQPSELNLQYVTIVGSQIISITAIAHDEGACPGRDGENTWDSATLSEFRPYLDAALHDSPLPSK